MRVVDSLVIPHNMAAASCAATSALVALLLSAARHPAVRPASTLPNEHFDFIVVGGGTAGCVVAARLSENPNWNVLVLEAGIEEPDISIVPALHPVVRNTPEWHWAYPTQPSKGLDKNQVVTRAKMLGGCSVHNGMTYLRGNKLDFEDWVSRGAEGWGYLDVLPVFKDLETDLDLPTRRDTEYHGAFGPQFVQKPPYLDENMEAFLRVWTEDGGLPEVDPNGATQLGAFIGQQITGFGQRYSTNRAYLEPARHRRNLRVVTGATVTRVHINPETKEAEHVEYTDRDGKKKTVFARKEIILSGGTYESPHILLLSGVGPAEQLKEAGINVVVDSPSVGKNLQDHFTSSFQLKVNLTTTARIPGSDGRIWKDAALFRAGRGPFTNMGTHKVGSLQRSPHQPESDGRPYVQVFLQPTWQDGARGLSSFCYPINATLSYYDQVTAYVLVIHPSSAGHLELNASSPESLPLIYQNVFSEEVDVRIHATATRSLYHLYRDSRVLRELGANVSIPAVAGCEDIANRDSDEYFQCGLRQSTSTSVYHPVGTCRMGTDDAAVVDTELRVKGVRRLRVVDAAVLPSVTSGNTNSPVIMAAERGARFLKAHWEVRSH